MEAEVVRMCCTMFNGDARTCGCVSVPQYMSDLIGSNPVG